ncbi:MAG: hypothetical protein L0Y54_09750, partial [Sporichthyaceae bacterium]|nr:hypothetical protein [Sporichthyaceae bacterium]
MEDLDFADVIGVLAAASAVALFLVAARKGAVALWRRTLGSRRDLVGQLDRLATGTTREYVEQLLGPPAFRRAVGADPFPGFVECVYRTPHAWVHILYDEEHGSVGVLSLTVDDPRFGYPGDRWTACQETKIIVGKSRFAELPKEAEGRRYYFGANRGHYAESHYRGNPGFYQTFVFAWNDAGVGEVPIAADFAEGTLAAHLADTYWTGEDAAPDPQALALLRADTTINTLTVAAPFT